MIIYLFHLEFIAMIFEWIYIYFVAIPVRETIPIIMGSNIGTTVTNTIVSLAQAGSREEFRKAFGGATIHDVFNWMCVIVLLPLEVISGYLFYLTKAIVDSLDVSGSSKTKRDLLKTITKPFIRLFVEVYVLKVHVAYFSIYHLKVLGFFSFWK